MTAAGAEIQPTIAVTEATLKMPEIAAAMKARAWPHLMPHPHPCPSSLPPIPAPIPAAHLADATVPSSF